MSSSWFTKSPGCSTILILFQDQNSSKVNFLILLLNTCFISPSTATLSLVETLKLWSRCLICCFLCETASVLSAADSIWWAELWWDPSGVSLILCSGWFTSELSSRSCSLGLFCHVNHWRYRFVFQSSPTCRKSHNCSACRDYTFERGCKLQVSPCAARCKMQTVISLLFIDNLVSAGQLLCDVKIKRLSFSWL